MGKGSAFKVRFQKGVKHFNQNEEFVMNDFKAGINTHVEINGIAAGDMVETKEPGANEKSEVELPKILIVEDNNELRAFLKTSLASKHDVYDAENGLVALRLALTYLPDIIVSDIMMSDMDGLELTKRLKTGIETFRKTCMASEL